MVEKIRTEDLDMSDEEKRTLLRALTDKAFRDELVQTAEGVQELSEEALDSAVGGVGSLPSLSAPRMRLLLETVRNIEGQIAAGAQVLCEASGPLR